MKSLLKDRTALLFLVWSGLFLFATASGHLHSPDGEVNYRTVRSLASGNGYAIDPLPDGFSTRQGEDGKEYPQYGPLQPLLATPLYWVGSVAASLVPESWLSAQADRLGRTVTFYRGAGGFEGLSPTDHTERVRRIFVSLFNLFVTLVAVALLALWGRELAPSGNALAALLLPGAYLLSTYAWPHSRPFYTEALSLLCLLGAITLAALPKGHLGYARAAGVGALVGAAVLARMDSAVAVPGILLVACHGIWAGSGEVGTGRKVGLTCAGVVAFVALASVLPLQNLLRFGGLFATGYEDQAEGVAFSIPFLTSLKIYLLSPGKGIFWYSPPLIVAMLAWPAFLKKRFWLATGLALTVAGYLLVIGRWQNLGGWCWGPRHLFQITALALIPLPLLFEERPWKSRTGFLVGATLLAGFAVQLSGVMVDFMWALEPNLRGLTPGEDTARILSFDYYGPLLHWRTWRVEGDLDWFLVDLWKSGATGARVAVALFLGAFASTTFALFREARR